MEEVWLDVKGYEGKYQISNKGRVKSLERIVKNGKTTTRVVKERILKLTNTEFGYYSITLVPRPERTFFVHRLVMANFVGVSSLEVNHIDGVKTNNNLENLEYVTSKGNKEHAIKIGLFDLKNENHPHVKLTQTQVKEIKDLYSQGNITQRKLSDMFNVSNQHISKIVNNKRRSGSP